MVVIDDRVHAAVIRGNCAEVSRWQPAKGGALEPSSLDQQLVKHLIIGRLMIWLVGHRLGPRYEHLLGLERLIKEGHTAARVGRVPVGDIRLVAPVVEEGDVTLALWPAVGREELGELVELEVSVEEGDGLVRGRG